MKRINHIIKSNFYNDYIDNELFVKKFNIRKSYIKKKYNLNLTDNELIKDYFVEIFSWTAMDKFIIKDIYNTISNYISDIEIIDPCSGNSFHTFLFHTFMEVPVITIDIQPEENSWIETIENDGLNYIKNMKNSENKVLLLSWIDFTKYDLAYNLLKNFKGDIVISVGNYIEDNSKNYVDELNNNFVLIKEYNCTMPWEYEEGIKIYKKKSLSSCFETL